MATSDKSINFVVSTSGGGGNVPSYISSMSPYQVRALQGAYAPTNGTSSLVSVMPSQWTSLGSIGTDIIRPWSGGAKVTAGTKMYVHGGGHADSHNNGLYSFDFSGTTRPLGWATEYAGVPGVTADISIGSTGAPISVHTYDGMVDMGASIYRFGGSAYPQGGFTLQMFRYDKGAATWTRLPSWPGNQFAGCAIGNQSAGKLIAMDRWVTYQTYAFYRVATNTWSALKSVSAQWISDGACAWDPATNTGLMIGSSNGYGVSAFSLTIDWTAETITQTARTLPAVGSGSSLVWDPTRQRYWCFGGSGNNTTMYQINPSDWTYTTHTLTGDAMAPETPYAGSFGRWLFRDDWRAIGTVVHRTGDALVIRLPP